MRDSVKCADTSAEDIDGQTGERELKGEHYNYVVLLCSKIEVTKIKKSQYRQSDLEGVCSNGA